MTEVNNQYLETKKLIISSSTGINETAGFEKQTSGIVKMINNVMNKG
jgi:hypothetical protein